jgi:secreted PhoX family phosphatase
MPDNIAYHASRGNWILEEDGATGDFIDGARNDDIWDCLDDGADDDTLGDGCVRIASLNDLDAESTGGFFDPTGAHYYVSIQHNSSGFGMILDITGLGITRSRQLGPLDRTTTRDAQPILRRTGGLCGSRRGRDGLPHVP